MCSAPSIFSVAAYVLSENCALPADFFEPEGIIMGADGPQQGSDSSK